MIETTQPCWSPRDQQVKGKSGGDITRNPKEGYLWPHNKDTRPPKLKNVHNLILSNDKNLFLLSAK